MRSVVSFVAALIVTAAVVVAQQPPARPDEPGGVGADPGPRQVVEGRAAFVRGGPRELHRRPVDRDRLWAPAAARPRPVRLRRQLRQVAERRRHGGPARAAGLARRRERLDAAEDRGSARVRREQGPGRRVQPVHRREQPESVDADHLELGGDGEVRPEKQRGAVGRLQLHRRQGRRPRPDEGRKAAVRRRPAHLDVPGHDGRRRPRGPDVGQHDGEHAVQSRRAEAAHAGKMQPRRLEDAKTYSGSLAPSLTCSVS